MDEQEWNDFEELFGSSGWRRLVEQAKSEVEALKDVLVTPCEYDAVQFHRGQISQLNALIYMEDMLTSLRNEQEEDDASL